MCVCVCVRVCVSECVCTGVRVYLRGYVSVFARACGHSCSGRNITKMQMCMSSLFTLKPTMKLLAALLSLRYYQLLAVFHSQELIVTQ